VGAALLTFFLKMWSWQATGSVSLLSDALESLANLAAAFIAVASLSVAARPADEEHAYGHTKAEYFASGIEGALILIAAAGIGWSAVDRLMDPRPLEHPMVGIVLSAVAAAINLAVARVLFHIGGRHHSVALVADAKHLMTDVWTSAVVIVAVALVTLTGWTWIDPALGLLLACHIVVTGIRLDARPHGHRAATIRIGHRARGARQLPRAGRRTPCPPHPGRRRPAIHVGALTLSRRVDGDSRPCPVRGN
jgi:cation diffusion facilitator family transporter